MTAESLERRTFVKAAIAGAGIMGAAGAMAQSPGRRTIPSAQFAYSAVALIGKTIDHGQTPIGQRYRVPILGGSFEGPDFKGTILPGGADWQLLRADGTLELIADYNMQTDEGVVIKVNNRGLVRLLPDGSADYAMTTPSFEAPMGRYDWLNQHIFVGTVEPSKTGILSVELSIYKMV